MAAKRRFTLGPVPPRNSSPCLLQILNLHRLHLISQLKTKNSGIKIQLAIQRPLDILRSPKAVLFALKWYISNWKPFRSQGSHHQFCLIRRNNLILQPLEDNQRTRQAISRMNR